MSKKNYRAFDALIKKNLDDLHAVIHDREAIMARDQHQQTPLHWSARLAVKGATAVLASSPHAQVNAQDQWGDTALHLAFRYRRPLEDVRALVRAGAKSDQRNEQGNTPVYEALCLGQEEAFKVLAVSADWDEPCNAEQQSLRQCVQRQRPSWNAEILGSRRSLGEALQGPSPGVTDTSSLSVLRRLSCP